MKVSWDDDIPNWMESQNPFMFQTTNQTTHKNCDDFGMVYDMGYTTRLWDLELSIFQSDVLRRPSLLTLRKYYLGVKKTVLSQMRTMVLEYAHQHLPNINHPVL